MIRSLARLAWLALAVLVLVSALAAAAAANLVPVSRMGSSSRAIGVNDLKPAECSAITLVDIITCSGGNCNGNNQNNLILGSGVADNIRGRGGNDCILGGGGNDTINGNNGGGDVCIGGPGTDTASGCESMYEIP